MGRSTHSYIPRAYCFLPSFVAPNASAGTDVLARIGSPPFGIGPDEYISNLGRAIVPVYLGVGWSAAITDAGTTTVGIGNKISGAATVHYLTKNFDTLATSLIANGYASLGYANETTVQKWDSAATKNKHDNDPGVGTGANTTLIAFCDVDTGDANDLAANYLCSPGGIYSALGSADPKSAHLRTGKSYHRGPVAGCLASVTLHDLDAASEQTDLDLREIEMPFSFRLHAIHFFSEASAASNIVRVYNQTQTEIVASCTTLVGVGPSSVTAHYAALTNRDLAKGDKLRLRVTTSGTGYTRVGAVLIGHVTAHPDLTRLIHYASSAKRPSIGVGNHDAMASAVSGPGLGSIVPLYMGRGSLAQSQTDETILSLVVPFDCEVLAVSSFTAAIASTPTMVLINTSESNTLLDIDAGHVATVVHWSLLDTSGSYDLVPGGSNLKLSLGDTLEFQGTSGVGSTLTDFSAILLVRPTGFPHPDLAND